MPTASESCGVAPHSQHVVIAVISLRLLQEARKTFSLCPPPSAQTEQKVVEMNNIFETEGAVDGGTSDEKKFVLSGGAEKSA
ncbi:hypothetical protein CHARACLAT_011183 [Characodon lateralis]|uniref:Uncharacterized protein n=1 Tax=Characodon lateralis TaxID=208331 RepID=A0ABU7EJG2_9TELE|nr:hypothetical protein [Characodon lateralis]